MKKLVIASLLLAAVAATPETKHAPLPPALMQAKTLYIQNDSGDAKLADRCYDELTKWGRFKIVSDPKSADVIFLLTTHIRTSGYSGHSTDDGAGGTNTTLSEDRSARTRIDVLRAADGQVLWSDSKGWGGVYTGFRSATRSVVKELRKRVEEQEAADAKGATK